MRFTRLTRGQLSENFERVAKDFYAFIADNGLEDTEVNMSEPYDKRELDLNLCDTPACHGGWAAIMYGVNDYQGCGDFYELGADRLAKKLGFRDEFEMRNWAHTYPEYWGNREGFLMFDNKEAFGKDDDENLCLTDIPDWYMNVARRLREGV